MATTIASRLRLKQLRFLVKVAETGSISKAAEALAIAQPALSRTIKTLENTLQVKLLNRGPRGIKLTAFGESLVSYGKIIESNLRFAVEEIDDLKGLTVGSVKVGVGPSEGFLVMPVAIDLFLQRRLNGSVSLIEGDFDQLSGKLLSGEIDIMFGPTQVAGTNAGLKTELLGSFNRFLAVRAEHPLAKQKRVTFQDISEADWILPPAGSGARTILDNIFINRGLLPPKGPIELTASAAKVALMLRRDLVTTLVNPQGEQELQDGSICALPVDETEFVLPMQLTTREFGELSPACKEMITQIKIATGLTGNSISKKIE